MKHFFFLVSIAMCLFFVSCQKQETVDAQDLYSIVQNHKNVTANTIGTYTRAGEPSFDGCTSSNEMILLPEFAYDYFVEYTKSKDVQSWSEMDICQMIVRDKDLSVEQKEYVAEVIGSICYLKEVITETATFTRSKSEEDCLAIYLEGCRDVVVENVGIGTAAGYVAAGYEGAYLGFIGGSIRAMREIRKLGQAYIRCCA